MKKKLITTLLTIVMVLPVISVGAFAETEASSSSTLNISEEQAEDKVVAERIDKAIKVLQKENPQLPVGTEFCVYEYDLGDNCSMWVELCDQAEYTEQRTVRPIKNFDSTNIWKEYGNRYFTAKATVKCGSESIIFSLENHYTLSTNGIDERYGVANFDSGNLAIITKGVPVVSKAVARSLNSTVSLYCNFSCRVGTVAQKYKLNTTVKYLSHDKVGKRLQVQQAWNLSELS